MFVFCMIPLSLVFRGVKAGYHFGKEEKKYEYTDFRVQTVQTFSEDKVTEFEIKKYGVQHWALERTKVVTTEGIKLPNWKVMKKIDDAGYKYLGIPHYDQVKQTGMKDIFLGNINRDWRWCYRQSWMERRKYWL